MSDAFLGEIRMVGFNFAPAGWFLCNGQILAISQYSALFALLGTAYGGNGTSTFGLPNLQGRFPMHVSQDESYVLGEAGGAANVTLNISTLPTHNHQVNCNSSSSGTGGTTFAEGTGQSPAGHYPGPAASPSQAVYATSSNATMNNGMIGNSGQNSPFSILPPFQVVNFIIAGVGIFPQRS